MRGALLARERPSRKLPAPSARVILAVFGFNLARMWLGFAMLASFDRAMHSESGAPVRSPAEVLGEVRTDAHGKVKVAVTDVDGILRGKYLAKEKFFSAARGNLSVCNVVLRIGRPNGVAIGAELVSFPAPPVVRGLTGLP